MRKDIFLCNLQNGSVAKTELRVSKGANYTVKKLKKKEQPKALIYDEVIYYDIETITKEEALSGIEDLTFEDIEEEKLYSKLNMDQNIIKSFSILVPKRLVENRYKKKFEVANKNIEVDNKEGYYTLFYYNEDSEKTLKALVDTFIYINQNRVGSRSKKVKDTKLKIVGFNNNSFDDQVLEHIKADNKNFNYGNIYKSSMRKCNVLELIRRDEITNKFLMVDLKHVANQMGLMRLKDIGEDIGVEKLKIEDGYKEYNNRDVEVLFYFLKMCNEDLGFFQWNLPAVSRKDSYQRMIQEFGVEEIVSDVKINQFRLIGGRSEGFIHHTTNVKYADFTSLYTSAAVKLDMVRPEIYENNGKMIANYKLTRVTNKDEVQEKLDQIRITPENVLNLEKSYNLGDFYLMRVKLLKVKPEFKHVLHIFPFSYKDDEIEKVNFQFKAGGEYEVGFYEVMFLHFFEYEIITCYQFKKGTDVLKEYKEDLYEKRKELKEKGDKKERFYKILLNAGYGIFASSVKNERVIDIKLRQKIFELQDINLDRLVFNDRRELFKLKKIGTEYYKENVNPNQKFNKNTIPLYAYNITSNARFMMYKIFYFLMIFGDIKKIIYTDTDSIILSQENYKLLEDNGVIGEGLGYMTDEYPDDEILEIKVFAPKSYELTIKLGKDCKEGRKGEVIKKCIFKGTGTQLHRKIYINSIGKKFDIQEREALNPMEIQKRVLEGNVFINKCGYSEDLKNIWNQYVEEYDKENRRNS